MKKLLICLLLFSLLLCCSGCFEDDGTQAYIEELKQSYRNLEKDYKELSQEYDSLFDEYIVLLSDLEEATEECWDDCIHQDYYNMLYEDYIEARDLCEVLQQECTWYEDKCIELEQEIATLKAQLNEQENSND